MNICTAAVRGGTEKSLSDMCKSKKQRHYFHSRPCPSEARCSAESMQGRGNCCGWCQDLRVSFCTAWDTCTLPGEGKIFSLCLDSFAPHSSRALRTCMVYSNALCYLSPSLSCPTVGLQPVTWPCGPRMRESMLTGKYALGIAGTWQHENCKCFGTRCQGKLCQPTRDMTAPQSLARLWDCAWN